MTTYDPCEAWRELLYGTNRGAIYQYFSNNKAELIDHLRNCEVCNLQASLFVENTVDMIFSFESMSAAEFAKLIREMHKQVQKKTRDSDTQP